MKFYGRKNDKKDTTKFMKNIKKHFYKKDYLSTNRYKQAIQVEFQTHFANKILD